MVTRLFQENVPLVCGVCRELLELWSSWKWRCYRVGSEHSEVGSGSFSGRLRVCRR